VSLNEVFKAIADPTRREILSLLRQRPMTAGEIAERFDLSKPSISHHLNLTVFEELVTSLVDLWKGAPHAPDVQK